MKVPGRPQQVVNIEVTALVRGAAIRSPRASASSELCLRAEVEGETGQAMWGWWTGPSRTSGRFFHLTVADHTTVKSAMAFL